jgi:hypothetical protein
MIDRAALRFSDSVDRVLVQRRLIERDVKSA